MCIDFVEIFMIPDVGGLGFPTGNQTPAHPFILSSAGELDTHQVVTVNFTGAVIRTFCQGVITIVKLAVAVGLFELVCALIIVKIL
jgi:hypothetical protein